MLTRRVQWTPGFRFCPQSDTLDPPPLTRIVGQYETPAPQSRSSRMLPRMLPVLWRQGCHGKTHVGESLLGTTQRASSRERPRGSGSGSDDRKGGGALWSNPRHKRSEWQGGHCRLSRRVQAFRLHGLSQR